VGLGNSGLDIEASFTREVALGDYLGFGCKPALNFVAWACSLVEVSEIRPVGHLIMGRHEIGFNGNQRFGVDPARSWGRNALLVPGRIFVSHATTIDCGAG